MIVYIVDCSHGREKTIIVFIWVKLKSLAKMDPDFPKFFSKLYIIFICVFVVFGGKELEEYLVLTIHLQVILGGVLPRTSTFLAASVALIAFL